MRLRMVSFASLLRRRLLRRVSNGGARVAPRSHAPGPRSWMLGEVRGKRTGNPSAVQGTEPRIARPTADAEF